jgi:hypothetical protein
MKIRERFILIIEIIHYFRICLSGMRVRRARAVVGAEREYCSCTRRHRSEICAADALFLSSHKYFEIRKCIATCWKLSTDWPHRPKMHCLCVRSRNGRAGWVSERAGRLSEPVWRRGLERASGLQGWRG